jgi:NADPH-dependent ferric siderophore reductase
MPDTKAVHTVQVARVERVVPRVVRVTFAGESLREFPEPAPGAHVRITFGPTEVEGPEARYHRRTLTPRFVEQEAGELVAEFVIHGDGLAANWAAAAQPGHPAVIRGPGGRYRPQAVDGRFVIAVDDTGVPAAGTVIEALPADVELVVLCEVTDEADERPVTPTRDVDVTWLHRAASGAGPGERLEAAVRGLPADLRAGWFVAAESRTVRRIDRHLRDERGVDPAAIEARGYWRHRGSG